MSSRGLMMWQMKTFAGLLVAVMLILAPPAKVGAQWPAADAFRPGEVVVEIRPGASIDDVNRRRKTTTIQRIYGTNFYRLAIPPGKKLKKVRKKLAKDPDVLSAAFNPVVSSITVFGRALAGFPDGYASPGHSAAEYNSQTALVDLLKLEEANQRSRGAGVVVAVIDTGIDFSHPALAGRFWTDERVGGDKPGDGIDDDNDGLVDDSGGWDFLDDDSDASEEPGDPATTAAGHGTFISGIIALVAPEARIMPLRAFDVEGLSDGFTVAAAIKYAADHGAHVINLSIGTPETSPVLFDAIVYARERGAFVIAAVGNENKDTGKNPQFPANWKTETVGVAATDYEDHKAAFSNYGVSAAVCAPGVGIISTYPGNNYARWSGTSFAAPMTAAEAALLLSLQPRTADVRGTIENTAVNIDGMNPGFAGMLGKGRIRPLEALQSLESRIATHAEIDLQPTGIEPAARGEAEISVFPGEQEFELDLEGLSPRAAYRVVVDGSLVLDGTANARGVASNFGGLKIEFSTVPSSNDLPLPPSLNPVTGILHVEVRDVLDRIVLQGDFGGTGGGGGTRVEKEVRLVATGPLPGADGRAKVRIEAEREELEVRADGLVSGAVYTIVADALNLGVFTAQSGFVRVEFATDGSGDLPLPVSLRPVTSIQRVEVLNLAGQVVLRGEFQPGGDEFGGGDDGPGGDGGSEIHKQTDLSSTGVLPEAEGKAEIRLNSQREELKIDAKELQPFVRYVVVVDGISLGSFQADDDGRLRLEWSSSEPGKLPLPAQVRPVTSIRRIEIRMLNGSVVLAGELPE